MAAARNPGRVWAYDASMQRVPQKVLRVSFCFACPKKKHKQSLSSDTSVFRLNSITWCCWMLAYNRKVGTSLGGPPEIGNLHSHVLSCSSRHPSSYSSCSQKMLDLHAWRWNTPCPSNHVTNHQHCMLKVSFGNSQWDPVVHSLKNLAVKALAIKCVDHRLSRDTLHGGKTFH